MSFGGWLDARDSKTLAREWPTLGARSTVFGAKLPQHVAISEAGVALLAASFLGGAAERFAWLASRDEDLWPPLVFKASREVRRCFLDGTLDLDHQCIEDWKVHELREGNRGIQHVQILYSFDMTGDRGSSASVVRLFDRVRSRAVSIPVLSNTVWTIGEPMDLSPLLFHYRPSFTLDWERYDLPSIRGFLARVTADLDAHFDTSPDWPGGLVDDHTREGNAYNPRAHTRRFRFAEGAFAIEIVEEDLDWGYTRSHSLTGTVTGLPWGHEVRVTMRKREAGGVEGWVDFTLPRDQFAGALARLAAVPDIETPPGTAL